MGKPKKRQNKFQYGRNRRRLWKKKKQLPNITSEQLKSEWDEKKSLQQNMIDMGLTADANSILTVKKTKASSAVIEAETSTKKTKVVKALETEAQRPVDKVLWMNEPDVQMCAYMLRKHGDDYEAMARDPKNHYQETARQIRRKVEKYRKLQEDS